MFGECISLAAEAVLPSHSRNTPRGCRRPRRRCIRQGRLDGRGHPIAQASRPAHPGQAARGSHAPWCSPWPTVFSAVGTQSRNAARPQTSASPAGFASDAGGGSCGRPVGDRTREGLERALNADYVWPCQSDLAPPSWWGQFELTRPLRRITAGRRCPRVRLRPGCRVRAQPRGVPGPGRRRCAGSA